MTGRPTQLDTIHEESDGEFSIFTGSDPDYNPAQSELSSSDVDVINLDKPSSFKKSSSDKAVESPDTDSGEVKDQQTETNKKCNIKKHKTPRNYVKRNKKKEKMNKDEVKTVTKETCTKRQNGKRSWDKKHYCLYCGKPHSKIARHLKKKHMEIEDVAYAFSFPVGSKYRKALLDILRSKGNFNHTAEVLEQCRKQLVMCKQPSHKALVEDYWPCTYCYGMFARKELWKHQFSCRSKKSCMTNERRNVQSHAASLPPIAASSDECQKIIDNMRQDDVSFHIRTDSLICRYGEALHAQHVRVKSRRQYVAQRMRELGQFMLVAKDMDKTVKGLEDLCAPSRFQFVVSVAKKVAECSPGKNEYGKPPTAAQIRFCLKGAVKVLVRQTLMKDDDLAERKAKQFLELLDKNWKNHVSVSVHQTIQGKRWYKQDDIPLTKNVTTLRKNLKNLSTTNPSVNGESPTSTHDIGPQRKGIPSREEVDDRCPDFFSTQKRPGPCREDETSDVDVENPMSPSETVPQEGRKRAREVDDDGCLDLFSPRKKLDPCNEDDEGSDLFCPEKTVHQSREDGSSDKDDQTSRKNLVTQKKSKKKREKWMVKGKEPLQARGRRSWSEAERMAVEKHLGNFLAEQRVPWKKDCLRAIQAEKALSERSWKSVKNYVCNKIVTLNLKKLKYEGLGMQHHDP